MKKQSLVHSLFLIFLLGAVQAQEKSKATAEDAVREFFTAFHAKDTNALRAMAANSVILQTLRPTIDGGFQVQQDDYAVFLKGLASIPDTLDFREELLDIRVQQDGPLAHAWTPYKFYLNGVLRHCGANSFQWLKTEEGWRLLYLVDTRRKSPCQYISNR